jgi:transposase-like protein
MNQPPEDIKRWTARRKAVAIMEIIKGKTTAAELARSHDLTIAEIDQWMNDFVSQGTEAAPCPSTRCRSPSQSHAFQRTGRAKLPITPWKKRCSRALTRYAVLLPTCCFVMTMAWSLDRANTVPW